MHFIKISEDRYLIKDSNSVIVSKEEKERLEKEDLESLVSGDIEETEPVISGHNKSRKAKD